MPETYNEDAAWGDLDWGSASEMESPALIDSPSARITPATSQETPPPLAAPINLPPPPAILFEQEFGSDGEGQAAAIPSPISPQPEVAPPPLVSADRLPEKEQPVKTKRMVFTPASVATLTLHSESGEESAFTISRDTTIGRHASNDLVIQDLHVSGHHAKLTRGTDGRFELTDLNSSGGTFVNGTEITTQILASGDEITFSTVTAVFHYVAGIHADSDLVGGGTLVRPKKAIARKASELVAMGTCTIMTVHPPKGQPFSVDLKGVLTVGRAGDNDVIIPDEHVSGHHAKIICAAGGLIEVVDLQSTCGTFINGVEIQNCIVKIGDRLRFGVVECTLGPETPMQKKAERKSEPTGKRGHTPMQMVFPAPKSAQDT